MKTSQFSMINILILAMLIFMSVFSTVLMPVKIVLIIAITIGIMLLTVKDRRHFTVNKALLIWMIIYVASNVFSMLVAFIYQNPYAFSGVNVDIIEPVLFFIIICYMQEGDYDFFLKALRFCFLAVCVYNLLYFCALNGFLPGVNPEWFPGMYANYGGFSIGFTKFHSNNLPWLMFLLPVAISELLIWNKKKTVFDYIVVMLGLMNALLTLRSGFIIAVIVSPVLVLVFALITKIQFEKKNVIVFLIIAGLLLLVIMLGSAGLRNLVFAAFNKVMLSLSTSQNSVDSGGRIRLDQIRDLVNTWKEKPVFGWGASANAKNIVRSDVAGAYEMQYFALLMQKGIVGFAIYVLQIGWLIVELLRNIKRKTKYSYTTFAILVGFVAILFANATNPYLGSFDRLLIFFIPLMAYKACRIKEEEFINVR